MANDLIFVEADDQYQLLVDMVENKWENVLVDCMEQCKLGEGMGLEPGKGISLPVKFWIRFNYKFRSVLKTNFDSVKLTKC